jgi:DNA processing protein
MEEISDETTDWMVLSQIPGVGVAGFWALVEHFGSPAAVLQCSLQHLQGSVRLRKNQLQGFAQKDTIRRYCLQQAAELKNIGGECLCCNDNRYPERLRQIGDPPPLLYVLGDHGLLRSSCVAVVGSRASTSYGSRTAFNLSARLAGSGVTIVSGLALGIDTEAHRGALSVNGKTIGVLGCGIDVIYPRQNRKLFEEIAQKGLIISEYPLGISPEGFRFPARNRIISGVSRGVVVVEAAKKSGSLITAQLAIDEGREVYAVPGQVDSYKSEGTHWLLQQGATLVQSANDILDDLGLDLTAQASGRESTGNMVTSSLEAKARTLLSCIDVYPLPRNELSRRSGMEAYEFSEFLLLLELEGLVEILPGDEIRRVS